MLSPQDLRLRAQRLSHAPPSLCRQIGLASEARCTESFHDLTTSGPTPDPAPNPGKEMGLAREAEYNYYVNDWLFLAPSATADSFVAVHTRHEEYRAALREVGAPTGWHAPLGTGRAPIGWHASMWTGRAPIGWHADAPRPCRS